MTWRDENGLALLALIAMILALGLVAWSFVRIISTQHVSSPEQSLSAQRFYLAESGLEIGKKYYNDFWMVHTSASDEPTWASFSATGYYFLYRSEPLGNGSFDLGVKWDTYQPQFISNGDIGGI
jgi:hypothetical protein